MPFRTLRELGNLTHASSKVILIWSIHTNRSAEGVSLLTQLLYILVFVTRYLDLFEIDRKEPLLSTYRTILKIAYITTSFYIVFIMMRDFARTREKEYAWKLATWSLVGSAVAALPVTYLFEGKANVWVVEVFWSFSEILESVCVLPQLLLLRQTNVPTVIDSYYLIALGSYRVFYVLNWLLQLFDTSPGARPSYFFTQFLFGIVQVLFYLDFAWVYYSRQRVKLRYGGIVDSDDLRKSFLVNRFIGPRGRRTGGATDGGAGEDDGDDENGTIADQENGVIRPAANSWGPRGISVSADDTLDEHEHSADAQMMDPSHFEDLADDDDDEADAPPPPAKDLPPKPAGSTTQRSAPVDSVESSAMEWQDDGGAK